MHAIIHVDGIEINYKTGMQNTSMQVLEGRQPQQFDITTKASRHHCTISIFYGHCMSLVFFPWFTLMIVISTHLKVDGRFHSIYSY